MGRHHPEVGDDRVVTVVRRDHEPDRFSARQRGDPPPLVRARVALEFAVVLLPCGLTGSHPGQLVAAVRVEGAVQHERHEFDEFPGVADRPEDESPAEPGHGRPWSPLQAQSFDEQLGSHAFERRHATFDRLPSRWVFAPVRRQEPAVLRRRLASGNHRGQRGFQQPNAVVGGTVDVEDVHEQRVRVARPRPPSGPGHHAVTAQREPQPFRAPAADRQVVADLIVEDVRQPVEQAQLIGPGDRAQSQVMLIRVQGSSPSGGALPAPGSAQLVTREDTSAVGMAYTAQPSFLITPDSSGHHFYPARPATATH